MSIDPGTRFGPYEIVEPIGAGGMGEVYRATDTNLKRDVALKVPEGKFSFAEPVQLFSGRYFTAPALNVRSYDVARDGRFLMIDAQGDASTSGGASSIVIVQNWTEELERRVPSQR